MRTLKDITADVKWHEEQCEALRNDLDKTQFEKLMRRLKFLRACKQYLETEPRPEFVLKMLNDLNERLERIDGAFEVWKSNQTNRPALNKTPNAAREVYNREMGVPEINAQVKMVTYILGR